MAPPHSDPSAGRPSVPASPGGSRTGPVSARQPSDSSAAELGALLDGFSQGTRTRAADGPGHGGLRIRQQLALLQGLLLLPDARIHPRLHPHSPVGHACPEVEAALGLALGESLELLEDLADLGLLDRTVENHVHLCPRCGACQLNFRETCPACSSLHVGVERLVHHFACANVAPESELVRGVDLVCPKCERTLHQLGQDFDRPGETFVCREGRHVFDEPRLEAQCLACAALFPGYDARVHKIHSYRATPLASRAVELNRLTGLDVAEMLQDAGLGIATRTFFLVELERELLRLGEQGGRFTLATLEFRLTADPYPVFSRLGNEPLRSLARTIQSGLRGLDLVCRWNAERLALLLLGTDAPQAEVVRQRLEQRVAELVLSSENGQPLEPAWRARTFDQRDVSPNVAQAFLDEREMAS